MLGGRARSGWLQRPRPTSRTKVEFGPTGSATEHSQLTLIGGLAPAFDVELQPSQRAIVKPSELLMVMGQPQMTPAGAVLTLDQELQVAGPDIMVTGPCRLTLSGDRVGQAVVIPLEEGEELVTQGMLVLWTRELTWSREPGIVTTVVRFTAPAGAGSGHVVVLHAAGAVLNRELADGESVLVAPHSLLYAQSSVVRRAVAEYSDYDRGSRSRQWWLRVTGPGRLGLQSAAGRGTGIDSGPVMSGASPGWMSGLPSSVEVIDWAKI